MRGHLCWTFGDWVRCVHVFIKLSVIHSNSFSSHECWNFQTLKKNNYFMSANDPRKTNQPIYTTHSKGKHFQNILTTHLSRHHTVKKQKYSNMKNLNKKLNRETTKKSYFFIKNPIKDELLLHNHKPQTKIIRQRKTKPLNDKKKLSFPWKAPQKTNLYSIIINPKRKS